MSMSPLLFRRSLHGRAGLVLSSTVVARSEWPRLSAFGVSRRTRRNSRALESFDFEHSAADCIQSYVPAASLWIGGTEDIGHYTGLATGRAVRKVGSHIFSLRPQHGRSISKRHF
jgi:hypothetical protein